MCDSFSHGGQPHVVVAIAEQHALFSPAVPRRCPRDTYVLRTGEGRRREGETEKDEIAPVLAWRTRDPSAVTALFRAAEFQSSYFSLPLAGGARLDPPLAVRSSRLGPAAANHRESITLRRASAVPRRHPDDRVRPPRLPARRCVSRLAARCTLPSRRSRLCRRREPSPRSFPFRSTTRLPGRDAPTSSSNDRDWLNRR